MSSHLSHIQSQPGSEAEHLLGFKSPKVPKESLHLPGPEFVDRIFIGSDRSAQALRSLQAMFAHGRLTDTGYLSILPVDQGIEHSAGASFAPSPAYFDPENIVQLAIEGGCSAVACTLGMLGAVAVGATIYLGPPGSTRQITEVSAAFKAAHELGLATILWCYTRNNAFKVGGVDYHTWADLSGQANHLGVTLEADIIEQKLPENTGGYKALRAGDSSYGKLDERMYTELSSDHPIDLTRYQVLNNHAAAWASLTRMARRARTTAPRRCGRR